MSVFVCDKCGCVENTALGHFWSRNHIIFPGSKKGDALCSECMPPVYPDGSKNNKGGKWHNKFPKVKWDGKREMENR